MTVLELELRPAEKGRALQVKTLREQLGQVDNQSLQRTSPGGQCCAGQSRWPAGPGH